MKYTERAKKRNQSNNRADRFRNEISFYSSIDVFCFLLEDELDILLKQLQTLEQRLDQTKMFRNEPIQRPKKFISPSIVAQFDELDQALATLTSTLNNVEIELVDSGNSSSSSAVSDSTTSFVPHQRTDDKHQENEGDEQFSDSGLSQSTDSISLPLKQPSQIRTSSQISNASSVCIQLNFHAQLTFLLLLLLQRFSHVIH